MNFLQTIALALDGSIGLMERVESRRTDWFFKLFPIQEWLPTDSEVLDIGCGSFDITEALAAGGTRPVIGIDIEDLRRTKYREESHSRFLVADGEFLPFKGGSFNAITLFWMLHHSRHPGVILSEVARIAAAGATVIIVEDVTLSDSLGARTLLKLYDRVVNLEFSQHPHNNLSTEHWISIIASMKQFKIVNVSQAPAIHRLVPFAFAGILLRKMDHLSE